MSRYKYFENCGQELHGIRKITHIRALWLAKSNLANLFDIN